MSLHKDMRQMYAEVIWKSVRFFRYTNITRSSVLATLSDSVRHRNRNAQFFLLAHTVLYYKINYRIDDVSTFRELQNISSFIGYSHTEFMLISTIMLMHNSIDERNYHSFLRYLCKNEDCHFSNVLINIIELICLHNKRLNYSRFAFLFPNATNSSNQLTSRLPFDRNEISLSDLISFAKYIIKYQILSLIE